MILCQFLHDGVHDRFCPRRQVSVDLPAAGLPQPVRQLRDELLQLWVADRAALQLNNALRHGSARFPLERIPRLILLLIDVHPVRLIDPPGEGGLDLPDAILGEIALLGICGEDDHVDVHLLGLLVESSVPAQVIRLDLIRRGDLADGSIDERAPVPGVVIAQPLRVLTAQRHHRRPYIAGVFRHLPYHLREILHLSVRVPQAMLAVLLNAGAVGDVVNKIFFLIQGLNVVLPGLLDERRGVALRGVRKVVLILDELLARWERLHQPVDERALFFCRGQCAVLIGQQLHAGAGGEVAGSLCQLCRVLAALEVGGNQNDPCHWSSGSMRR